MGSRVPVHGQTKLTEVEGIASDRARPSDERLRVKRFRQTSVDHGLLTRPEFLPPG